MKGILRNTWLLFFYVIIFCSCLSYSVSADDNVPQDTTDNSVVASGVSGDLNWSLYTGGLLKITGTGWMNNFTYNDTSDWRAYSNSIRRIEIMEGVKNVGEYAFYRFNNLLTVEFPSTVNEIAKSAFAYSGVLSLTIPENTAIKSSAFMGCNNLEKIFIPASITSLDLNIFVGCDKLKSAGPTGSGCNYEFGWAESIPANAFCSCSALETIILPDGLKDIGKWAFAYCSNLTQIQIPETVINIGASAFYRDAKLVSIVIPEGVISIGANPFDECTGLRKVVIPSSVSQLSTSGLFSGCTKLISAGPVGSGCNIEFGWTNTIPDYAFYKCSNLERIVIPVGLTTIGACAFEGCKALRSVDLPVGLERIGNYAFNDCTALEEVVSPCWSFFSGCPVTHITIPNGVVSIKEKAFINCSIKSIDIPESVIQIGESAFSGCTALEAIILPENLNKIDSKAFYRCGAFTNISIPRGVSIIEDQAFDGCRGLKNISLLNGLTKIGYRAFAACTSITDIIIPSTVIRIDHYCFCGCSDLKEVTISNGVKIMGNAVFENCKSLANVNLPGSLYEMGSGVFNSCNLLTSAGPVGSGCSIQFGWNKTIPRNSLSEINSLTSVVIPDGVKTIELQAFCYCSNLKEISIPDSMERIGDFAFGSCNNLKDIYYGGTSQEWSTIINDGRNEPLYSAICHFAKANLTYHANNGSSANTVSVIKGEPIKCPTNPVKPDFWFGGWYVDNTLNKQFNFSTGITSDTNIYAKWVKPDFILPSSLRMIQEEAFAGGIFTFVKLSEQTQEIGPRAFADCNNLSYIYIPTTTNLIDSSAFDSEKKPIIICSAGSKAEYYAQEYGYSYINIE